MLSAFLAHFVRIDNTASFFPTMTKKNRKKSPQDKGSTVNETQHTLYNVLHVLSFRLLDPKNVPWIVFAFVIFLMHQDDRKAVAMAFVNKTEVVLISLCFIIIIMAIVWFFTRRLDKMEIERLAQERDELQKKLDISIHSSEETRL